MMDHIMTADDFGMGNPMHDPEPGEPQTHASEGHGSHLFALLDVHDLASLNQARLSVVRRRAADAIDHLIALMDALDADIDDMEPENDHGDELDLGEADESDNEPTLGAPERHPHVWSMHAAEFEPADGSRYVCRSTQNRQTHWSAGNNSAGNNDGEAEPGYDLPEGDDEHCGSDVIDEASLGAPENHDRNPDQEHWSQGGGWGTDAEYVNEDGGGEFEEPPDAYEVVRRSLARGVHV